MRHTWGTYADLILVMRASAASQLHRHTGSRVEDQQISPPSMKSLILYSTAYTWFISFDDIRHDARKWYYKAKIKTLSQQYGWPNSIEQNE
jgi:hypothetical protein